MFPAPKIRFEHKRGHREAGATLLVNSFFSPELSIGPFGTISKEVSVASSVNVAMGSGRNRAKFGKRVHLHLRETQIHHQD